ncbi:MAG: hypothetical protein JST67_08450 [Bacteroidetes bacterium]|nr:hypothetical protein [Bacteroidota bacterium]
MSINQQYEQLNPGRKRILKEKYIFLFGSGVSFYRKINNKTKVLKAEQIFFTNFFNNENTLFK